MKKVAFYTLGCKVNQYETNAMIEQFIKSDYELVDFEDVADIYVINTCTVTNMSDRKSRQIIRRVKQLNTNSILAVTGCYAQVASEELEKIEEIDLIVGNTEKKDIVEIIENYTEKINLTDINNQKEFVDFGTTTYTEKTRAVVKVQDGCNNFCSYCIIPYAKGRVRSRKLESIIKEIKSIVETGIQEIVITGIHVASYGLDLKDSDIRLIDLLEEINKIEGLKRIRLGSLEPNIITEEFVERLKKVDKICDHFHLSLQSGCDDTLKRMNRKYTTDDFEKVVERLRSAFPNVILTTDIIVGFPGETEEEFKDTYNYLKKINFYKMHVFKYSQRKGTRAAVMPDQIDGNTKEQRSHKLMQLSDENEEKILNTYIGETLEVLFEQEENGYTKGHTSNYLLVKIKEKNIENQIIKVKIIDRDELELIGTKTQ
jgi:threonylcarbamoyladenosine tRNA methylthiotransferase MtaB